MLVAPPEAGGNSNWEEDLVNRSTPVSAGLLLVLVSIPVLAVTPAAVITKEGDIFGSRAVSAVNSPFTDGNGKVGFVASFDDSTRGIWHDAGFVFNSDDALPDVLTGGESTMGVSNSAGFIYSPSFNGGDSVYTHNGKLLADDDPIPSTSLFSSFNSRPQMAPDGTAYWVGGYTGTVGGSTAGRMLLKATDTANVNSIQVLYQTGDIVAGFPIGTTGVGFDYGFSDNSAHDIQTLVLGTGSTSNDDFLLVDGLVVAQESLPNGSGDNWDNFDVVSINNAGHYLFSGDTDGPTSSDEFLAYDGSIVLREGDTVAGRTLGNSVGAASLNNLDGAVFLWASDLTETLFFAADLTNLASATALLSVGELIDVDQDMVGDFTIDDFNASNIIGPGLDFATDGFVYVEVDMTPVTGGPQVEAVIRLQAFVPEPHCLVSLWAGLGLWRRRRSRSVR